MPPLRRAVSTAIGSLAFFVAGEGAAQAGMSSTSASLSAGAFFHDFAGATSISAAPMVALRGTRRLSRAALLEVGLLAAFPAQSFGERTTFLVPEVQLQFHRSFGWIVPYFGFGGGAVADIAGSELGGTDFDVTMSAATGVRMVGSERFGVKADVRVRGIGAGFDGFASELSAGILWRFGRR